ncbi:MAG: hypothetical protein HQK70_02145 [Desulfamplus sp.]|nr:hypothetical protein [Desulfamplus sp.]
MKKNSILYILCLITLSHFSMSSSNAVENIFYIDASNYPFSGPSTIVSLDDGLSMAVINRVSKKISKIKHDQVVFERAIENFEPFDLLAINGQLFVSSKQSGEVRVLSQIDFSLMKIIYVDKSVSYMVLSSDRTKIFVASSIRSADTIHIIDVASKIVRSPPIYIPELNQADKLVIGNGKLFASSQISPSIVVVDEKKLENEVIQLNFGLIPDDMIVTDKYLYLSSVEESLIRIVELKDDLKESEKIKDIHFIGSPSSPSRMIFDGKQYIYALNNDRTGKVFRLDINTNEFDDISCFQSGHCFYTGAKPEDGVISRDGKVLYVSNNSDDSVTYHYISGKLFIEPRTITVKPSDDSGFQTGGNTTQKGIKLKAGGGSGSYIWSAPYGKLSSSSGEEVFFTPPSDEDIYEVTVTDADSPASLTAEAKIIVVNIRVTPERITMMDQSPQLFNITGGTPPYEISALQGGVVEHSPGESSFTFSPPAKDGVYTIEVKDRNEAKGYTTVEFIGVPPLPADASRAAIIVVGGPPTDNIIWSEVRASAEKLYYVLNKNKGFRKEEIYLLSPVDIDIDLNGVADINIIRNPKAGFVQKKDVKAAFEWAGTFNKLDQPLFVFFLGHGIIDEFMLNDDKNNPQYKHTLTAANLKQYIDEYQNASGRQVVIVMDSCHSGSFIDDLSGKNRAVITSTGSENYAFYTLTEKKSLHSFISYFTDFLSGGSNFLDSYTEACKKLKNFYRKALCENESDDTYFQNPQYDDNGDKIYFDFFMDTTSSLDGEMLKKIQIKNLNKEQNRNRFADASSIFDSNVSDMTLSVVSMNKRSVDLFTIGKPVSLTATVGSAQGAVKNVYGILKPPGMENIPVVDENGVPYRSYPQIKLSKTEKSKDYNMTGEVWETEWNGAVYKGCYEINFYAESENGSITFSEPIEFGVYDPSAFDLPKTSSIDLIFNGNENSGEYSPGDRLNISVIEHLNWGYDLYVALIMPDGTFLSFYDAISDLNKDLNKISFFTAGNEESVVKWKGERTQEHYLTVLDFEIPVGFPTGQYYFYAVMSPQMKNLFNITNYWKSSYGSFVIKP